MAIKRAIVIADKEWLVKSVRIREGITVVSHRDCGHSTIGILVEGDCLLVDETDSGCPYPVIGIEEILSDG